MARQQTTSHVTGKTVLRTFRIPKKLDKVLAADAEENNTTMTSIIVAVLTRYAEFDRFAQKFGFVTFSKGLFRELLDAIPEERIREIATSQSEVIVEMVEFWHEKKDVDSVLAVIDIFSKYMRRFEYTVSRSNRELAITMRSDMGRKFALFMGVYWAEGINRVLGVTPRVEIAESQATLTMPI